jgi:hypothetical protein
MIRILNDTKGQSNEARVAFRTNWSAGTAAFPIQVDLIPGAHIDIPRTSFDYLDPGVKQFIAEYMAQGIIRVLDIDTAHRYMDKNHNPEYDLDYLIGAEFGDLALTHAINMATSLNTEMDRHFLSLAVHDAATAAVAGNLPTNLATLLVWIGNAQTAYDTNHRPSLVAHAGLDTTNTLAPVAAVDLATAISALQELFTAFQSHKTWLLPTANELDIEAVLTF